ncbi:MAG: ABC transporter permease, partial [Acetanaerobacterium sp.]
MFWHLFSYRLRCSVRTKEMMFWSAAFPLVLATLFGLAFSNLNADEPFSRIPIAVVETHAYQSSEAFRTALDADAG